VLIANRGGDLIARDTYPPVCLWVRWERPLADAFTRSMAVVGTRAATSYGHHIATGVWKAPALRV
jgi:DNA processing protein